ncbi:hypothetical protein PUR49_05360 [Streptomyces sp. BE147]|uniref:hypothetical protein n=1 Tax=Streptomyces sp. BE147 TaxID=3002524 RepID=UPI002E75CD2D|nr:hypothetical protein [Streptomyces sp. BE147]MEE1735942.1 hypothetical protein [Streptomyces sp. BE147]
MTPIPPAAAVVIEAAIDDYRCETPAGHQTPEGLATRIGEYLVASGYEIRPGLSEAA